MAIHPRYADAILEGRKTVEFRKRRLASDIGIVLVYATAPISSVIGSFTVETIDAGTPEEIWTRHEASGAITHDAFFGYYGDGTTAIAIIVGTATRFADPIALDDFSTGPAVPQSFAYLPTTDDVLSDYLQPA